jgi:hypothetical protein
MQIECIEPFIVYVCRSLVLAVNNNVDHESDSLLYFVNLWYDR